MERTSTPQIDYAVLRDHFHLPISQVAKELGVCATVLKKLCRQNGIPRWPHRKIKSLNKMIAALEESEPETEEEEQQKQAELFALRKKKEDIMENPQIIGPTYSHISPRFQGKQLATIGKFSAHSLNNSSPSDISQREQNVLMILERQRKLSASQLELTIEPSELCDATRTTSPSIASSRFSFENTPMVHHSSPSPRLIPQSPLQAQIWTESTPSQSPGRTSRPGQPFEEQGSSSVLSSGDHSGQMNGPPFFHKNEHPILPVQTRYSPPGFPGQQQQYIARPEPVTTSQAPLYCSAPVPNGLQPFSAIPSLSSPSQYSLNSQHQFASPMAPPPVVQSFLQGTSVFTKREESQFSPSNISNTKSQPQTVKKELAP